MRHGRQDVRSPFVGSFDCLSFLTDYGLDDGFVATCHGVAARIAPGIRIIDITHLVPPGDVRRGAAVLAQTLPYLPRGVHVAVVDPGVGTTRRGIAVQAADGILVGPTTACCPGRSAGWAGRPAPTSSPTANCGCIRCHRHFHGRDIFMPVAAHLANGADLASVGSPLDVMGW